MTRRYAVARMDEVCEQPCPCGTTRRAFVDDADQVATLHRVRISADARVHFHKALTEIYYVLDGQGHMELDGDRVDVAPGTSVLIKPLCRHRAVGELQVIVVAIPAFDPDDEWFDETGDAADPS